MASILHHPVAPTAPHAATDDEQTVQKSVPQQRQHADSFGRTGSTASPTRSRQ